VNQLGDYFDTTEGGTVDQPVGSYFESTPGGHQTPPGAGEYFTAGQPMVRQAAAGASPDGIGRALGDVLSLSPLVRDLRKLRPRPASYAAAAGFGQTETELEARPPINPQLAVAAVMTGVIVRGIAGYFVGKAVAPSQQVEKKYAWWGVPTAIIFGTVGMGVEAGIALSKR
jgi:hypothetical protein